MSADPKAPRGPHHPNAAERLGRRRFVLYLLLEPWGFAQYLAVVALGRLSVKALRLSRWAYEKQQSISEGM